MDSHSKYPVHSLHSGPSHMLFLLQRTHLPCSCSAFSYQMSLPPPQGEQWRMRMVILWALIAPLGAVLPIRASVIQWYNIYFSPLLWAGALSSPSSDPNRVPGKWELLIRVCGNILEGSQNENIQFLKEGEKGTQWNHHALSTCSVLSTHTGPCLHTLSPSFSSLPIKHILLLPLHIWVNRSSRRWRDFPNSTRLVRRTEPELKILSQHTHLCTSLPWRQIDRNFSKQKTVNGEISWESIL